jgi:hypothetical protein
MYVLDESKLKRARLKLAKLLEKTGRAPIVYPLGPDADGVFHFWVITVKETGEASEYITSVKPLADGREIAGCICQGGESELHCYHVAAMLPVYRTYAQVFRDLKTWIGTGLPTHVAHLRAVS